MIKNVLNKFGFVRIALVAGVGFPLIFASTAPQARGADPTAAQLEAQDQPLVPSPAVAEAERVIVTGSNIPTAQEETSLPVTTYTADFLLKTGAGTPVEGLRQLPTFVGNAATENNSNGGSGAANINLRGIGPENTLVLINGRRSALGATFDGQDVNLIPISAINKVEILKDGASSIYGSDAVAGVVDFMLYGDRRLPPYEGAEFEVRYGTTTDSDANERQAWIRGGVTGLDGKVAIFASAEYYNRAALMSVDRFIAQTGNLANGDVVGVNPDIGVKPLNLGGINNNSPTFGGALTTFSGGNLVLTDLTNNQITQASYRPFIGSTDPTRYNFRAFTPAIPAYEKSQTYISGRYKVFGDALEVYGDMLYAHYRQNNALAGAPFALFSGPASEGGDNVELSPFNPWGDDIFLVRYRLQKELGNRTDTFDKNWWHWLVGAKGDFEFANNGFISHLGYDAGITYEDFQDIETDGGDGTLTGINNLVAAGIFNPYIGQQAPVSGVSPIYNNTNPAAPHFQDGVPIGNAPYNNAIAAKDVTAGGASYLGHSIFHEKDFFGDITINANLFPNLWNGGIGVAGGYNRRWQQQHSIPDPVQAAGDQLGFNQAPNFKFQVEANAYFFETRVPLVISTMNVPFVYNLEVDYAFRYEEFDYSDLTNPGPHNTASFNNSGNSRVTVRYQPIPDLLLRGTWGESFAAPDPFDMFVPPFEDFPVLFDPITRQTFQPLDAVSNRGNLALKPETSQTWTAGGVYSPKFLPGFTISADWYQIFTTNLILSGDDFAQVQLIADPFGPGITREPPPSLLPIHIDSMAQNAGQRFVQGIDVNAVYQLPTTNFGRFTFTLAWNHFFTWKAQLGPGLPFHNFRGQGVTQAIPLTPGGIPDNKGFLRFEWEYKLGPGLLDFVAQGNYIQGQWDDPAFILGNTVIESDDPVNDLINPNWVEHRRIASYMTLDLQASYEFVRPPPAQVPAPGYSKEGKDFKSTIGKQPVVAGVETGTFWQRMLWGTKVTAGVVNAFDRQPPTVLAAFNDNYDTSLYSIRDRFWYVALSKKF